LKIGISATNFAFLRKIFRQEYFLTGQNLEGVQRRRHLQQATQAGTQKDEHDD